MKLKMPPQPLVFAFDGPTALCAAVTELYRLQPRAPSALCVWRGRYYLQVSTGLLGRRQVWRAGERFGQCLGASPVLYAFCREHGREISQNAVAQLGRALLSQGGRGRKSEE